MNSRLRKHSRNTKQYIDRGGGGFPLGVFSVGGISEGELSPGGYFLEST